MLRAILIAYKKTYISEAMCTDTEALAAIAAGVFVTSTL